MGLLQNFRGRAGLGPNFKDLAFAKGSLVPFLLADQSERSVSDKSTNAAKRFTKFGSGNRVGAV